MSFLQVIFYVFSTILVASSLMVITVRNPVRAALFLVLAFFSAACIWLTLEAEFLAITLVLVYVGAVMVLFLFVIMLLNVKREDHPATGFTPFKGAAAALAARRQPRLFVAAPRGENKKPPVGGYFAKKALVPCRPF